MSAARNLLKHLKGWIAVVIVGLASLFLLLYAPAPAIAEPSYTKEQLQQGDTLAQKALEASQNGDFATAEKYWTQLIEQFPDNPAVWSNRGNIRVGQNQLEEAIADFDRAIELAPNSPDPYLNRGTAYEGQGRYDRAIADYNKVLELSPDDAMAYNNRGNAKAAQGNWPDAIADYQQATQLAPSFAFAQANYALALYQTGEDGRALQSLRNLARKYPMFPDVRAALTAILWEQGQQGEAESNWVAAVGLDNRYQELQWVRSVRRWPPEMVTALEKFLNLE